MTSSNQIFVALLDEGVDVWRPAPALKVGPDRYVILRPDDYDPDVEAWEFQPGTLVECEMKRISDGEILAAVRPVALQRRIA